MFWTLQGRFLGFAILLLLFRQCNHVLLYESYILFVKLASLEQIFIIILGRENGN